MAVGFPTVFPHFFRFVRVPVVVIVAVAVVVVAVVVLELVNISLCSEALVVGVVVVVVVVVVRGVPLNSTSKFEERGVRKNYHRDNWLVEAKCS